jgi:hypothetical protein
MSRFNSFNCFLKLNCRARGTILEKIQPIHLLLELVFPTKPNPQFSEISAGVCLGENIVILKNIFFMVDLALKMATLRYCSRRLVLPAP